MLINQSIFIFTDTKFSLATFGIIDINIIQSGGLFMDRVEKSKEKYKQLFGDGVPAAYATDPDFQDT